MKAGILFGKGSILRVQLRAVLRGNGVIGTVTLAGDIRFRVFTQDGRDGRYVTREVFEFRDAGKFLAYGVVHRADALEVLGVQCFKIKAYRAVRQRTEAIFEKRIRSACVDDMTGERDAVEQKDAVRE